MKDESQISLTHSKQRNQKIKMSELHDYSMATTTQFSLDWNLQSLNTDMSLVMDPLMEKDDFSTGYLEDALYEFGEMSKRRRVLLYNHDDHDQTNKENFVESYWNSNAKSNCCWGMLENFSSTTCQITSSLNGGNSDEQQMSTLSGNWSEEPNINIADKKKSPDQEAISASIEQFDYSSTLVQSKSSIDKHHAAKFSSASGGYNNEMTKKKNRMLTTRVVYPFALVKPGGTEGDMTINDINERILMPPTRPVRHPVGNFAWRSCVSADGHGPGLSGKAVVALTRIHTQGRGTITIIRTKG